MLEEIKEIDELLLEKTFLRLVRTRGWIQVVGK